MQFDADASSEAIRRVIPTGDLGAGGNLEAAGAAGEVAGTA